MTPEQKAKVLIVDDEPEIGALLADKLAGNRIQCQTASDPLHALEMVGDDQIDVLISDVIMPGMTGFELLQKVRATSPNTRVILITGVGNTDWVKQALRYGAFDYLDKPLNLQYLHERVLQAITIETPPYAAPFSQPPPQMEKTDPLTGLLTHRHFMEQFIELTTQCQQDGSPMALCLLDIDQFREINSSDGFLAGDTALKRLAEKIRHLVRTADIVARYGGDEFVILLPRADLKAAWSLAERIRNNLSNEPIVLNPSDRKLTLSIGLVEVQPHKPTATLEYLDRATEAVYHAKLTAPGAVVAWSENLTDLHGGNLLSPDADSIEQMVRRFRQLNQRLTTATIESTRALAAAVEARDPYTKWHSLRVANLAQVLAQELKLPHQQIQIIYSAGLLHDIGKIGIPDSVLTKQGPLTDREYELIKQHPRIGANILEQTSFFHAQLPLILHHHERFDGQGYPDGLNGQRIPLGARVLQVADSIEAMISARSYKDSYPLKRVVSELRRCSGAQFDPMVAELAVKTLQNRPLETILPTFYEKAVATTVET